MKIGILGWGSLLWETGSEFEQWHDPWERDDPDTGTFIAVPKAW